MVFGASGGPKKFDGVWVRYDAEGGGIDGHEPGMMDLDKQDATTVTRCTSTRFAVAAYCCGIYVAQKDLDYRESTNATWVQGVAPLEKLITLTHYIAPRTPVVYCLGIGRSKHETSGQSQMWSIVENPDGTCHGLQ